MIQTAYGLEQNVIQGLCLTICLTNLELKRTLTVEQVGVSY